MRGIALSILTLSMIVGSFSADPFYKPEHWMVVVMTISTFICIVLGY